MELIKLFLERISQYNFLTNIIPGTILCLILHYLIGYKIIIEDNYYHSIILFYFVGVVNGRVGSLLIEPLLKKTHFVTFAPYSEFIKAESKDSKITILSQENNVYRSYITIMVISLCAYLLKNYDFGIEMDNTLITLIMLLLLFALSYRKQTAYIRKRVEKAAKKGNTGENNTEVNNGN